MSLKEWVQENGKKFVQIFAPCIFSYLDVWERKFHFLVLLGLKKPTAFRNNLEYAVFCSSCASYIEIIIIIIIIKQITFYACSPAFT